MDARQLYQCEILYFVSFNFRFFVSSLEPFEEPSSSSSCIGNETVTVAHCCSTAGTLFHDLQYCDVVVYM